MKRVLIYLIVLVPFFGMGQVIQFGTLGGGFSNQNNNAVRALFYDTIGKKLYAGGNFALVEGKKVWGLAVWDGIKWDSLKGGLAHYPSVMPTPATYCSNWTWKILRFQNKIYFVGAIDYVDGKPQCCIAIWNGTDWDYPVAELPNGLVRDIQVRNGILYACGDFTKFGNTTCNYVAKFDGISWQPVGDFSQFHFPGHTPSLKAIEVYNNEIYVGGQTDDASGVIRNIAKFDGTNWVNVGTGIQQGGVNYVYDLQTYNNKLYIGGYFLRTDEIPGEGLVTWNGSEYVSATEYDLNGHGNVYGFTIYKNKLAVLGGFNKYGPYEAINLLFIDSEKQCSITGLMPVWTNTMYSWAWASVASIGDSLVLGGQFNYIETVPAKNIGFIRNIESSSNCIYTEINENYLSNSSVKIYPTPASDYLYIEMDVTNANNTNLTISNALGQSVFTLNGLKSKEEINLECFPSGIYFFKVQISSEQKVFKVVRE